MKKGATLKSEIQRIQKKSDPPKQYQRGWTEFYKLRFYLTPDVLIPRPETELLVDEVLRAEKEIASSSKTPRNDTSTTLSAGAIASAAKQSLTILDLGTGSGCIAIAITKNLPNAKIIATDVSQKALEIAQKNAKFHHVEKQIIFLESDLLPNFKKAPDVIVANLPYIPTTSLMHIDPMVTEWEPKIALDGGEDGFALYRKLFSQLSWHLRCGGIKYLICEIDENQGDLATAEAERYFPNSEIEIKKDLSRKNRILIVKF